MLKFDWAAKLQFGLQYLSAPKFSTFPQLDELFVKELNSCTLCCCWVSFCDLFYHHIQELINLVPGHLLFNDCVVFGESWCFGVETSIRWPKNLMFKLPDHRAGGDTKYYSMVIPSLSENGSILNPTISRSSDAQTPSIRLKPSMKVLALCHPNVCGRFPRDPILPAA